MKRIIFSNNATLSDMSTSIANYYGDTETFDYVAAEDYIFIGSDFAFNSFFLKVGVVNSITSAMTLEYWDGSGWSAAVETIDETSTSGAALANDGHVSFVPDKHTGWVKEDTTSSTGSERITGLGNITIYDKYWVRISYSANLSATTTLSYIGYLFSNDNDLKTEYPDLNNSTLKTAVEAGKTTWEEQAVRAGELLIEDLSSKGLLDSGDQLLDRRKLIRPCVSKTAEIIYNMRGDDFEVEREKAFKEYQKRITRRIFTIDQDSDGLVDDREKKATSGVLFK